MLDGLKVGARVHVMGTSYGGMVAYRMAHLFPEFVEKVVCWSSGVMMTPTTNDRLLKEVNVEKINTNLHIHHTGRSEVGDARCSYNGHSEISSVYREAPVRDT